MEEISGLGYSGGKYIAAPNTRVPGSSWLGTGSLTPTQPTRIGDGVIRSIDYRQEYYNKSIEVDIRLVFADDMPISEIHAQIDALNKHVQNARTKRWADNTANFAEPLPGPEPVEEEAYDVEDAYDEVEVLRKEMNNRFDALEEMLRLLVGE